jgi:PIN domain nuclease of toxin-antitoxin system
MVRTNNYRWTQEHEKMFCNFISSLQVPAIAHKAVKAKMKRKKFSPEMIEDDRIYLLSLTRRKYV